ncbi:hypothetical protein AAHZ94_22470 [Streptomyces sp. HSW2009]|uniref:hypothetical protein n=1 Tax=Streptomyces sp. HSW2009 TaxID=3142890 RepID=UPI0032EE5752
MRGAGPEPPRTAGSAPAAEAIRTSEVIRTAEGHPYAQVPPRPSIRSGLAIRSRRR